jgi:hypothetical protein
MSGEGNVFILKVTETPTGIWMNGLVKVPQFITIRSYTFFLQSYLLIVHKNVLFLVSLGLQFQKVVCLIKFIANKYILFFC